VAVVVAHHGVESLEVQEHGRERLVMVAPPITTQVDSVRPSQQAARVVPGQVALLELFYSVEQLLT
jgi:hypothetical protein